MEFPLLRLYFSFQVRNGFISAVDGFKDLVNVCERQRIDLCIGPVKPFSELQSN